MNGTALTTTWHDCSTSWPSSSSCDNGYCNHTLGLCVCNNGWFAESDLIIQNGRTCSSNMTYVRVVWSAALLWGIISIIAGIYKMRQTWHATKEASAPGAAPIGAAGPTAAPYRVDNHKPVIVAHQSNHPLSAPSTGGGHMHGPSPSPIPPPPPPNPIAVQTQGLTPKGKGETGGPTPKGLPTAASAPAPTSAMTFGSSPKGIAAISAAAANNNNGGLTPHGSGAVALTITSPKGSPISANGTGNANATMGSPVIGGNGNGMVRRVSMSMNNGNGGMIMGTHTGTRPRSAMMSPSSHQSHASSSMAILAATATSPALTAQVAAPSTAMTMRGITMPSPANPTIIAMTSPPPTELITSPLGGATGHGGGTAVSSPVPTTHGLIANGASTGPSAVRRLARHGSSDSMLYHHQRQDSKLAAAMAASAGAMASGGGTELSQNATDKPNKETEPSSMGNHGAIGNVNGGVMGAAEKYTAQINARKYRQWVRRATSTLGFRMSLYMLIMGVSQSICSIQRIISPSTIMGRNWNMSIWFGLYSWICFAFCIDFCYQWLVVYNALSSFMPAAGVTPLRYGKETFGMAGVLFTVASIIPILAEGAPDDTLESLGATMWFIEAIGMSVIMINFLLVAGHVRQLLLSHINSTRTNEANRNGGTNQPMSASAKARVDELQAVVTRLTRIRAFLLLGGGSTVPIFAAVAWIPWLRIRQCYWIAFFMVSNAATIITAAYTLKYTIRAVEDKVGDRVPAKDKDIGSPVAVASPLPPPTVRPLESPPPAGSWMGASHQNSPKNPGITALAFPLPSAASHAASNGGLTPNGTMTLPPSSPNGTASGRFLPRLGIATTSSAGINNNNNPNTGTFGGMRSPQTPSSGRNASRVAPFGGSVVSNGSTASGMNTHSQAAVTSSIMMGHTSHGGGAASVASLSPSHHQQHYPRDTILSTMSGTTSSTHVPLVVTGTGHLTIPSYLTNGNNGPPTTLGGTPLAPLPSSPMAVIGESSYDASQSGPTSPELHYSMIHQRDPVSVVPSSIIHQDTASGSNSGDSGIMMAPSDTSFGVTNGAIAAAATTLSSTLTPAVTFVTTSPAAVAVVAPVVGSSPAVQQQQDHDDNHVLLEHDPPSPQTDMVSQHQTMTTESPPSIVPMITVTDNGQQQQHEQQHEQPVHFHASASVDDAPMLVLPANRQIVD